MTDFQNKFTEHAKIEHPIICGAMYPCSNPELIAAVSEAGGLGIVQPLSLTFVHGHDLRSGLKKIRETTSKPIGFNILVEKSIKIYQKRMEQYLDIALEEGVRFFITALGDPSWVIKKVKPLGGIVYHDVTERKYVQALALASDVLLWEQEAGGSNPSAPTIFFKDLPASPPLLRPRL